MPGPFIPDHPPTTLVGQLARRILGPIPAPVTTTIGPGAIPLENYDEYIRKVAGTTLGDLGQTLRKLPWDPSHLRDGWQNISPEAKNIIGAAESNSFIRPMMHSEAFRPGTYDLTKYPGKFQAPERIGKLMDELLNVFHPSY